LVITQGTHEIDGPDSGTETVDEVRLVYRDDGTMRVVGSDTRTEPVIDDPSFRFTGRACGVTFWPES
jgi:hypothetical protein